METDDAHGYLTDPLWLMYGKQTELSAKKECVQRHWEKIIPIRGDKLISLSFIGHQWLIS